MVILHHYHRPLDGKLSHAKKCHHGFLEQQGHNPRYPRLDIDRGRDWTGTMESSVEYSDDTMPAALPIDTILKFQV